METSELIAAIEALKSQSGKPSAHNRAIGMCIAIIRQHEGKETLPSSHAVSIAGRNRYK